MNANISESPTIAEVAGAALTGAAALAVKYDANGKIVLAGAGEHALGILPLDTADTVAANARVTVINKQGVTTHWKAGATFAKGAELTPDAAGKAAVATTGNYIIAVALEAATSVGQIVKVQIIKCGKK